MGGAGQDCEGRKRTEASPAPDCALPTSLAELDYRMATEVTAYHGATVETLVKQLALLKLRLADPSESPVAERPRPFQAAHPGPANRERAQQPGLQPG